MFVDAHTHLDHYQDEALETVLAQIVDNQILTLSNATDIPSYQRNLEIARRCDLVQPSFGIHPWQAMEYVDRLDELTPLIAQSPTLGEIGLDYHWVKEAEHYPGQRKVFEFFLAATRAQDKVVNLHTKGAEQDILDLLDRYQLRRVIVHWYSGPADIFREMVQRGFYFTIGVEVLHSEKIQQFARELPVSQLLTETDNPGGWKWFAETPGMPAHIKDVVQKVAKVRGTGVGELREAIYKNFTELIKI